MPELPYLLREILDMKRSNYPFDIKPKHWWSYLNPFWWRRRKILNEVLNYYWEKKGKKQFEEAYRNMVLYGNSLPPEAWKTDEHSNN